MAITSPWSKHRRPDQSCRANCISVLQHSSEQRRPNPPGAEHDVGEEVGDASTIRAQCRDRLVDFLPDVGAKFEPSVEGAAGDDRPL